MSFTNFAARRVLNSFLGGATPNSPNYGALTGPPTHLAAHIGGSPPTEAGANFSEPVGNGYARLALTLPSAFVTATDADPSVLANASALTFAAATGLWGTVTHVGLFDASGGGNLHYIFTLSASRTIDDGETLSFGAGDLALTLD